MIALDIHTHHHDRLNAVINLAPGESPQEGYFYSAGLHPWDTALPDAVVESRLAEVERLAALPQVVAIGEAGLDRLRGAALDRQAALFRRQVAVSEAAGKPMILHVVRAFSEIIALKKELKPSQKWIVHGFRGKPQLAAQLLREDFYISLGEHFNPATAAAVPPDRLFVETDESLVPLQDIVARLPHEPAAAVTLPL